MRIFFAAAVVMGFSLAGVVAQAAAPDQVKPDQVKVVKPDQAKPDQVKPVKPDQVKPAPVKPDQVKAVKPDQVKPDQVKPDQVKPSHAWVKHGHLLGLFELLKHKTAAVYTVAYVHHPSLFHWHHYVN